MDWISPLDFANKQKYFFNKWHNGTWEWFLDDNIFREWLDGDNTTLWCHGVGTIHRLSSHTILTEA
jgi:hypothetical protein